MAIRSVESPRYSKRAIAAVGGLALLAGAAYVADIAAGQIFQYSQPHFLGLENFQHFPVKDPINAYASEVFPSVIAAGMGMFGGRSLYFAATNR